MHPPQVRAEAEALIAQGINDCEISRRLGIPRRTILDWRRPTYVPKAGREVCPRCWRFTKPMRFSPEDYTELLGLYLGDGCISEGPRTYRLRLTLDLKYPKIIEDSRRLLQRCFPGNSVAAVTTHQKGKCTDLSVYSQHLPCLLPQHGPGKKHERPIVLEPWQANLLDAAPWPFIRGCIRSDACVFVNRTDVHRDPPYEYVSYDFSNMSEDIVRLFTRACAGVGVEYRLANGNARGLWDVRINRRPSVALMLEHVGLKA